MNSIGSHFISRNNDFDGGWVPGRLLLEEKLYRSESENINLCLSIIPENKSENYEADYVRQIYSRYFWKLKAAYRMHIPVSMFEIRLSYNFQASEPQKTMNTHQNWLFSQKIPKYSLNVSIAAEIRYDDEQIFNNRAIVVACEKMLEPRNTIPGQHRLEKRLYKYPFKYRPV